MQTLDNSMQQSFAMKAISRNDPFSGGAGAPGESRFEKADVGAFFETAAYAHFGRKLQKIYPVPPDSSAPEEVRILLKMIQAKLNNFPLP
ncbi:MAG TPA: hypothetical protein VL996_10300 [Methylocella sp.]|nr:hypothetical protein [Methylocella sp.]